jgi:hypothetical protein
VCGFRVKRLEYRVQGLGRMAHGSWFREEGFGFAAFQFLVSCSGCRVLGSWFQVSSFWFQILGFGFRISGFRLRVLGFEFRVLGVEPKLSS